MANAFENIVLKDVDPTPVGPRGVTNVDGRVLVVDQDTGTESKYLSKASVEDKPATDVPYTVTTPGDWPENPDPTHVQRALDILAERTALLGGTGQIVTDTQAVSSAVSTSTTSSTFVDLSLMTLTTVNGGGTNIYVVMFSVEVNTSSANKTITLQIMIDGVADTTSVRSHKVSASGSAVTMTTFAWKASVGNAKIIKVQWNIDSGTATALGRTLIIQGSE